MMHQRYRYVWINEIKYHNSKQLEEKQMSMQVVRSLGIRQMQAKMKGEYCKASALG